MEQNLNNLRSRLRQCSKAGVLCVLALFLLVEGRTEEPPEGKYLATADVEEDQGGSVIQNQTHTPGTAFLPRRGSRRSCLSGPETTSQL